MKALLSLPLMSILLLAACGPAPAAPPPPLVMVTADPLASITPTPFQPDLPTPSPSPAPTETATASPTLPPPSATPSPSPSAAPATQPAPVGRAQYLLFASLDYTRKRLEVDEYIAYTNHAEDTLAELVLNVEPNLWADCFALRSLAVNGTENSYTLNAQVMQVPLSQPLAPGETALLALSYHLNLPYKGTLEIFGYNTDQMNLTNWYPFIVPYESGVGWLVYAPWTFGEHLVYDAADFEVNIRQVDSASGVVIAASAGGEQNGEWTRYRLAGARTFVFAASDQFSVSEAEAGGVRVLSYTLPGHGEAGVQMAIEGARALDVFSSVFVPYPNAVLSIVESDYADGMEYDGLVFLSSKFYAAFDGSSQGNLVPLGVHEIAHQWWFGLVGNNQATEPWLDETLATYSERIYFERTSPALVDWWWNYRVYFFQPSGWLDISIYDGGTFRGYTNAVYLTGAIFMEALRGRIGDEAFYAFLQSYLREFSGRRASTADFFRILREHTEADVTDLQAEYFQVIR